MTRNENLCLLPDGRGGEGTMSGLEGYATLVTGGGSGIGEACAAALARDQRGVSLEAAHRPLPSPAVGQEA